VTTVDYKSLDETVPMEGGRVSSSHDKTGAVSERIECLNLNLDES
jgi:hypothetical protein